MNRFIRICSALLVGVGIVLLGFGLFHLKIWITESEIELISPEGIPYYYIETLRARLASVSMTTGAILLVGGLIAIQIERKKDE